MAEATLQPASTNDNNGNGVVKVFDCFEEFDSDLLKRFSTFCKELEKSGDDKAIIRINSPGGYISTLNSMLSIMESMDVEWHAVAIGRASSAAQMLLSLADVRYATVHARLMHHEAWSWTGGSADEMQEDAKRLKELWVRLMQRFAKRTNKPARWWKQKSKSYEDRCFYFYADEAKELGAIDYIGSPEVSVDKVITITPPPQRKKPTKKVKNDKRKNTKTKASTKDK